MITKTMMVSLFALSLLALSGVGFAVYSASVTINGTASGGTLVLGTSSWASGTTTPTGAGSCAWSDYVAGSPATITLTVTNMAPGDSCTASLHIDNLGTLPMTSESTTFAGVTGYFCTSGGYTTNCFFVTDSLGLQSYVGSNGANGLTVSPGGSYPGGYWVTVTYASGSTVQSESASFTITFTGSVGT